MKNQIYTLFAQIMQVEPDVLNNHTSPENLPAWSSVNMLLLISELESRYRIKFSVEELLSIHDLGTLVKLVSRKSGNSS